MGGSGEQGLVLVLVFAAFLREGWRRVMKKIFSLSGIALVAIALVISTTSTAEALRVCKAPGRCKNVYGSVNSGRSHGAWSSHRRYGGPYGSSTDEASEAELIAIAQTAANRGDTAVTIKRRGGLFCWNGKGLGCSETEVSAVNNDGFNDVPQGQVIVSNGQVTPVPTQVYSRPTQGAATVAYAPRVSSGATLDCSAIEESCKGLPSCPRTVDECYKRGGQ